MKSTWITPFTIFWVMLFITLPSTAKAMNLVANEPATISYTTNGADPASTTLSADTGTMSASVTTETAGIYLASEQAYSWQGTYADRLKARTTGYDYRYGDEQSFTYTLPWSFTFYGQAYGQITVDTNGNIWFTNSSPAHSFDLINTGKGPVIAAWNNDLNSTYYGGVFVQHKTSPVECVVVEWLTETYDDAGFNRLNNFEAVLYPDGKIRLDYKSFDQTTNKDFGSGVSLDDGTHYVEIANTAGGVYTFAGKSLLLTPYTSSTYTLSLNFTGTGKGFVVSSPMELACNTNCSALFAAGTEVSLYNSPSLGSKFSVWGSSCSGTGSCTVSMNANKTVTAQFDLDPTKMILNENGGNNFFATLQAAYNAAAGQSILKVQAVDFNEDLNANLSKTVTLVGGYNGDYTSNSGGETVLHGSLTVSSGQLIVESLVVQ